jgi:copper chaperone CopZ
MTTQTFHVQGMTCAHCVAAVSGEVQSISGVTDVLIDLNVGGPSALTINSDKPIDEAVVAAAVDEAGYELTSR